MSIHISKVLYRDSAILSIPPTLNPTPIRAAMNILPQAVSTRRLFFGLTLLLASLYLSSATRAEDVKQPVSFVNDVIPVLTKAGCNMGTCHAKAGGGQNGFQLSLLGFEPLEDYDSLVKEAHGRRLFPVAPTATSSGFTGSSPLYSSRRTSGYAAAVSNVTVTAFEPAEADAMFLA